MKMKTNILNNVREEIKTTINKYQTLKQQKSTVVQMIEANKTFNIQKF